MTPAARFAAAIEVLDRILAGDPAERVLTNWARGNRFAGSKDRAAIRDHVFDALRRRRSFAALGGSDTGRGLILGALRASDVPPETVFTGETHAPQRVSPDEISGGRMPQNGAEALDCPDWLWPLMCEALGDQVEPVLKTLQSPAPVGLRVNLAKTTRASVRADLASHGLNALDDPRSPSALVLTGRPRGLAQLAGYTSGAFELQDVGSQWLADQVPLEPGQTLVDFCAGGGGKTLAIAARVRGRFVAHDASPRRMEDLPARAKRAGVAVTIQPKADQLPIAETVLADVPCSGTGTWRRTPDSKWRFHRSDLDALIAVQARILDTCGALVRPGGHLVYATCSVLRAENSNQIEEFLNRNEDFMCRKQAATLPDASSDGYFVAVLERRVP